MGRSFLSKAFIIGGIYDLILGFPLLLFYKRLQDLFNVDEPEPNIFIPITALFLLAVGYLLLYTAPQAESYVFVGISSAFVRIGFAITVFVTLLIDDIHWIFVFFAITDILTATLLIYPVFADPTLNFQLLPPRKNTL
ncbi:MAG: hypothetical protein ACXAB7_04970 [Candidatus Kariarchaeaceae archaeon]|jgi:hypothetical protein